MTAQRFASTVASAIVVATLLCAGCTSQPGTSTVATAATSTPSPTLASAAPGSPLPAPVATPASSPSVEPSSEPPAPPAGTPMAEPPAASLTVEGGDPVVGELGSFTWNNAGSDAPWLPGYPIHVGAGERLTFTMSGRVAIDTWQVSRVLPSAVPGGDGAVGIADGTGGVISFEAPPSGRWSVAVNVRFGDNGGDAVYYWAVTVD